MAFIQMVEAPAYVPGASRGEANQQIELATASSSSKARKLAALFLLLTLLVCFIIMVHSVPTTAIVAAIESCKNHLALSATVIICAFLLSTICFLPVGATLCLLSGFLFGLLPGALVNTVGYTLGETGAMLIGRNCFQSSIAEQLKGYETSSVMMSAINKDAVKIVLLMNLSPYMPASVIGYLLGNSVVPVHLFALGTAVGCFPVSFMYSYYGQAMSSLADVLYGDVEEGHQDHLALVFFIIGMVATILIAVYISHLAQKALQSVENGSDLQEADSKKSSETSYETNWP